MDAGGLFAHGGAADDAPPPLTAARFFTEWTFEPVPFAVIVVVGLAYLYGVRKLTGRGVRWSRWRTISFVGLGLGSAVVATQSSLAVYDRTLLWTHMVQHMVLNMIVPIFLALGAPITLALRTLRRRPRGWLLTVLHSRVAKVATFPAVAGVVFVANPWALYFTGWYEATLRSEYLHNMNHLHFVLVGALWFWPLLGLDPMPSRLPHAARLLAVFTTLPFHAWLGITIMSMSTVLASDWYLSLARDWDPSPMSDQRIAGGILWTSGDFFALLIFGVIFVQWVRASEREAAREDRRLDRLEAQAASAASADGREGVAQA